MAKRKCLGKQIANLSEDELQEWAQVVLNEITDRHVMALHVAGWKIVGMDYADQLWPFDRKETGWPCPNWCSDISPKPKLSAL